MSNNNTPNTETNSLKVYKSDGNPDGTVFGQTSTELIGFHGVVPTAMRASSAQDAVTTTAATSTTPYGFATKAQADALVTLVNELRAAMVAKGLIKGSA